jgi:ADP-ribosylglycohydrolase
MTLFTAEGMIRAYQRSRDRGVCDVPTVIQHALLRWLFTQTGRADAKVMDPVWRGWLVDEQTLRVQRAPGNTCLSALEQILAGAPTPTITDPINDSKGCGAVMRSAPAGLATSDRREAFELGRDTGTLTHGHPSGYLSAAYLASLVFDLVRGVPLLEAMGHADSMVRAERGHEELTDGIILARAVARSGPPTPKAVESLGEGWVGNEALAIALLCALTAETRTPVGIADALWRAVLHSGDSDSTGSITGNLLGAIVGVKGLPPRWLSQVELRPVIERLGKDLYAVSVNGAELEHIEYPPN